MNYLKIGHNGPAICWLFEEGKLKAKKTKGFIGHGDLFPHSSYKFAGRFCLEKKILSFAYYDNVSPSTIDLIIDKLIKKFDPKVIYITGTENRKIKLR